MLRVTARAPVYPTEDLDRVLQAVRNLFPDAEVAPEQQGIEVVARGGSLARLSELIHNFQIPDTARGVMLRGRKGEVTRCKFSLGKQAALMGRVNFGGVDSPLGSIDVVIEADTGDELDEAIFNIAPDTTISPEWSRVPYWKRPEELQRRPLAAPVAPAGEKVVLKQARAVSRADEVETGEEGGWEKVEDVEFEDVRED